MTRLHLPRLAAIAALTLFALVPAAAKDKDKGHGHGHGKGNAEVEARQEAREDERRDARKDARQEARRQETVREGAYFNDDHRNQAREYYGNAYGSGKRCPPGLAKKDNGCMPPGQARKWAVGQPVPRGVQTYSVPVQVVRRMPPAPAGYRYARIGNDLVLVRQQNNVVVDIVQGLLR